jgi:hypothetical protein
MKLARARAVDRSLLLLGTLGLAGKTYGVPSAEFWANITGRHPALVIVLLAVVGVFGALTPVEALTARARVDRALGVRKSILTSFGRIADIARNIDPPLEIGDLAVHIWRIRRTWRHPVTGVLTRVTTYRLGTAPQNMPFSPPKGVGIVGLCWQRDGPMEMDVASLARELDTEEKYESRVHKDGGDAVMNLSWDQFEGFRHRGAVFAMPIRNGRGKFIGCVSVDASHGYAKLSGHRLQRAMTSLCETVSMHGFESC